MRPFGFTISGSLFYVVIGHGPQQSLPLCSLAMVFTWAFLRDHRPWNSAEVSYVVSGPGLHLTSTWPSSAIDFSRCFLRDHGFHLSFPRWSLTICFNRGLLRFHRPWSSAWVSYLSSAMDFTSGSLCDHRLWSSPALSYAFIIHGLHLNFRRWSSVMGFLRGYRLWTLSWFPSWSSAMLFTWAFQRGHRLWTSPELSYVVIGHGLQQRT